MKKEKSPPPVEVEVKDEKVVEPVVENAVKSTEPAKEEVKESPLKTEQIEVAVADENTDKSSESNESPKENNTTPTKKPVENSVPKTEESKPSPVKKPASKTPDASASLKEVITLCCFIVVVFLKVEHLVKGGVERFYEIWFSVFNEFRFKLLTGNFFLSATG